MLKEHVQHLKKEDRLKNIEKVSLAVQNFIDDIDCYKTICFLKGNKVDEFPNNDVPSPIKQYFFGPRLVKIVINCHENDVWFSFFMVKV
jgi:hypothetical protein